MTDYESWLRQLDADRPDWPLEFADQRDLLDALRPLMHAPTAEQAAFARELLRGRVGSRLWAAVQSWSRHQLLASKTPNKG